MKRPSRCLYWVVLPLRQFYLKPNFRGWNGSVTEPGAMLSSCKMSSRGWWIVFCSIPWVYAVVQMFVYVCVILCLRMVVCLILFVEKCQIIEAFGQRCRPGQSGVTVRWEVQCESMFCDVFCWPKLPKQISVIILHMEMQWSRKYTCTTKPKSFGSLDLWISCVLNSRSVVSDKKRANIIQIYANCIEIIYSSC